MSLKKTERYHGRIAPDTKARWVEQQKTLGFGSLAAFIEDTMEQTYWPVDAGVDGGTQRLSAAPTSPPPVTPSAVIQTPGTVTQESQQQLTVPGADLKVCPSVGKHRKGVFCKGCKKVIR